MVRRFLLSILFVLSLAGCVVYPDLNRQRLASLPEHYANFDMALAWETRPAGSATEIDGVLKNRRYQRMVEIEVWVSILDASGKVVARSVSYVIPRVLQLDEVAPFSLTVPAPAPPGTRLLFTYRYYTHDDDNGLEWMQSFDAIVPSH